MVTETATGMTPETVLRDVFGFPGFRPGQREVIDAVLEGKDCIAVMPPHAAPDRGRRAGTRSRRRTRPGRS